MALNFGSLQDGVASQAAEQQLTQTTPEEVLGATAGAAFDSLPTVSLLRQQQRYNESGPDTPFGGAIDPRNPGSDVDAMAAERGPAPTRVTLQPDEANAKAKAAGAQVTFDKPIADATAQSVIDDHVTAQQRADVIARNGNSILSGQVGRFVTSSLVSLADPINLTAMMIPVAPEAFVAEKLAAAASVWERAAIRGAAGAANGAVGMAALEPLTYAMSKSDYNDWSAGDALRNIFIGAALGAGGHMLMGGLFGREHLDPNTSMEATRAAIAQAADGRPVDVADLARAGELNARADAIDRGLPPVEPPTAEAGIAAPDDVAARSSDDLRAEAQDAAKDMADRAMNPTTDPVIDQAARVNKATIDSAPPLAGDIDKDLAEVTKVHQELDQRLQQEIASGRITETQEMRDNMLEADHTENVGKASANYAACLAGRGLS